MHFRSCRVVAFLVSLMLSGFSSGKENFHPLKPADTSSPRATLKSFNSILREVYVDFVEKGRSSVGFEERQRLVAQS